MQKNRFSFKCQCGNEFTLRIPYEKRNDPVKCTCGAVAVRLIGTSDAPIKVFDTVDEFTMVKQERGHQEVLEKRAIDHYNEVDAKRIREEFPEDCVVTDDSGAKKEILAKG